MPLAASLLIAFFATLICIWVMMPVAHHIDLVDKPGGRKQHLHHTPLIGGIAIFFGFCIGLLTLPTSLSHLRPLIAASALLLLLGITDDYKDLSAKLRLVGQIGAACIIVFWGHTQITTLGNLFGSGNIPLNGIAPLFTIFVIVGYINALNMLDGQDGLAGLVTLVQLVFLTYIASRSGVNADALHILAATVLGFLIFNMPLPWRQHAKIFLGDSGSTLIAILTIYFAIHTSQHALSHYQPMTFLWVIAYPVFDLISVSLHRIRNGKSPLSADRDHLHHLVQAKGFSKPTSIVIFMGIGILVSLLGLTLNTWSVVSLPGWILAGCAYILCTHKLR